MEGRVFGRLTVKGRSGSSKSKEAMWLCMCECGTEKVIRGRDLRSGSSSSCGCLKQELAKDRLLTHGMSTTRFYKLWADMNKRCSNPGYKQFYDYGGRGIKVDPHWDVFENFIDDMYESYVAHEAIFGERDTSIDRINVDGNYTLENCKWSTLVEQARNRRARTDSPSGVPGVSKSRNGEKWKATIHVDFEQRYLGTFEKLEDAIAARKDAEEIHWQ